MNAKIVHPDINLRFLGSVRSRGIVRLYVCVCVFVVGWVVSRVNRMTETW